MEIRSVDTGEKRARSSLAVNFSSRHTACRIEELPGTVRRLQKNEHLFQMGDPVYSLYLVYGGALKSYTIDADADEQVLAFYRGGDMIAFDAFANGKASHYVVAIDVTAVRVIPARTILRACRESGDMQNQLLQGMNREIRRLAGRLQMERYSAEQRIAAFLIEQSEFEADRGCSRTEFTLPMSRTDLARYLNLATETISRIFGRLQDQDLLAADGKRIHLKKLADLRRLASLTGNQKVLKQLCA